MKIFFKALFILVILSLISSCDDVSYDPIFPESGKGAAENIPVLVNDESEGEISPAIVVLEGISETTFNAVTSEIHFKISNGFLFSNTPESIGVFNNGLPINSDLIRILSKEIIVTSGLFEGKNALYLTATDAEGRLITKEAQIWAGKSVLSGTVVDNSGVHVNSGLTVIAKLADDQSVSASYSLSGGVFKFLNLPDRTIIFNATGNNGQFGLLATHGGTSKEVKIKLMSFNEPSQVENNDLILGLQGWNFESTAVTIIPHIENLENTLSSSNLPMTSEQNPPEYARKLKSFGFAKQGTELHPLSQTDNDLMLTTSGEGEQSISRTFVVKPKTKNVTVRYKFVTTEIPGGYFGTQYNDYYNVSVRNQTGEKVVSDSGSMNGLGLSAFDSNGSTSWRETHLSVKQGDVLQASIVVANVADAELNSHVIIDKVEETSLSISNIKLYDIDNTKLEYLSASPHSYFNGNTRVHGTITIEGSKGSEVKSIELEILQNGSVVATGKLIESVKSSLLKKFDESEKIEISSSRLLFEIPSTQLAKIDGSKNGTLLLKVRVKATKPVDTCSSPQGCGEDEATKDSGTVGLLIRYTGNNRYGQRDEQLGGDDWSTPASKELITHYSAKVTCGDFSNMNGGGFSPHHSHQKGVDVDCWYEGYNNIDEKVANTMIELLNDTTYGKRIKVVYVTFQPKGTFANTIASVVLKDGRKAVDVIKSLKSHDTHFHWNIN